jgi:hypothetical protein
MFNLVEFFALLIGAGVLIGSYFFYDSKEGRKSVYFSWYSGWIDFLAFLSGFIIFTISLILYLNHVPVYLLAPLFISGTFQGMMHVAKFLVRYNLAPSKK